MTADASLANDRFSPAARAFHWASALFVVAAWTLGLLGDELPRGPARHTGEFLHILLGELVVVLLVMRFVWRFISPPPPGEPTRLGRAGELAAKLAQVAIYALLLTVPIVGVITLFHGGEPLPVFGVADIPSPWPKSRELKHYSKEIHELLAHSLMALVALHAAFALLHHFVLRDRTLKRMLPAAFGN
jgi:cytochrome b561